MRMAQAIFESWECWLNIANLKGYFFIIGGK